MFASASARIFAQAATIFDEKISSCRSHRLLFVKAVGSPPPVSSHRASRLGLAPLFQQAASCLRASLRKCLCAEIPPPSRQAYPTHPTSPILPTIPTISHRYSTLHPTTPT